MKILALYPFLPYPVVSGAALRGCAVLDVLTSRHEVTLVSFVGRDDSPSELVQWPSYPLFAREPVLVPRTSEAPITPAAEKMRSHRPKSKLSVPDGLAFFDHNEMWNQIASLNLDCFDAVHIRFMSMALYGLALKRAAPHLKLVLDLDDNPSLLLYRNLRNSTRSHEFRKALWTTKELVRTLLFEFRELRKFDSVWICSEPDRKRVSRRAGPQRTMIVENVVDAERLAAVRRPQVQPALLMIADFNYPPNGDGAAFLLKDVWPLIREAHPEAQLWLVGKNNRTDLLDSNGKDGVSVTGRVDDVKHYLGTALIAVAPIFVGTGTKLKILEALAAGLPVVTTHIGAEGIETQEGVNILLADDARQFAAHCINLLGDPDLRERLAKKGQELVRAKYDISVMYRAVNSCYDRLEHSTGRLSHSPAQDTCL